MYKISSWLFLGKLKSVKISFIQEKLWMWIAKYIIYTWNLTGEDYILRVIEEGSLSVEALPNALTILSYIPEELRIISGNKDLATFAKTRLITDWHKVYDYIWGILNSENIKDDTVKATFKTLEEWIIKSDKFYSHEEIQSIIFNALNSKWFVEVKSILSTVIIKSQNAKLFLNANLDAILDDIDLIIQQRNQQLPADFVPKFKTIQPNEQRFLDSLVNFIIDSKENFKAEIDDIESEFCSNISDLTIDLFQNFEVLIYEDSERAVKIFEVILMILSHKSRSISLQAIEFFGDFKESISIIKAKYTDLEFFIEPYFEAVKIVLEKSKRKLFQQNESGEYFELEDSDNDKQEDISHYREYAADLFFNLYHICEMLKRNDKKAIFEDMLWEMFYINENNPLDHVWSIEVAIFAAKSTYEALELPRDKLIEKVWKCILKMGDIWEPTILHSSLLFFNDWAEYLIYDKSVITQTLNYIKLGFSTFKYLSWIQTIIFKWLVEIWQNMSNWKTSENDFDNSAPK